MNSLLKRFRVLGSILLVIDLSARSGADGNYDTLDEFLWVDL